MDNKIFINQTKFGSNATGLLLLPINRHEMAKNLQKWLESKKRFKLNDKQIQMARELGLNPKKFGSLNNYKQEPWKAPLPQFIENIYFKHFKRESPLEIIMIAEKIKTDELKNAQKKAARKKGLAEKKKAAA